MSFIRIQLLVPFLSMVALTSTSAEETTAKPVWPGPAFIEASGVCQGSPGGPLWGSALSWDRHDLHWHECEPRKGEWNEAHPVSGFWEGDLDSYMTRVHLPAARIIRELGGKVVYGGWPCCGSLKELTTLLDKHDAWSTMDVVDVHYFGLNAFEPSWINGKGYCRG